MDKLSRRPQIDSAYVSLEVNLNANRDSILALTQKLIDECNGINYEAGVAKGFYIFGKSNIVGAFNYPKAFDYIYKAQRIFEKNNLLNESAKCNIQLGLIYYLQRNFEEAKNCFSSSLKVFESTGDTMRWRRASYLFSLCCSEKGEFANAKSALDVAYRFMQYGPDSSGLQEFFYGKGVYFARQNQNDSAIASFLRVSDIFNPKQNPTGTQLFYGEIAQAYYNKGDSKRAHDYAEKVVSIGYFHTGARGLVQSNYLLYKLDMAAGRYKDAAGHLSDYVTLKDSMLSERKSFELASIKSKYEIEKAEQENKLIMARQAAIQDAQLQQQRFLKNLFIVGCFFFVILIAFLIYTNNLKKHKNAELAESLEKLKNTQEQLIRHEKLASMGKLSAGIAHEIRNPINFITNFSELSEELLTELSETSDEAERKELIGNLHDSMAKIKLHGRRADGIVKNMLDHSRSYTPPKELCNLNTLCETNLSMAINAIRVQNPSFICKIERMYDSRIPDLNIVSADIGRVLLNIFNNAFHALEARENGGDSDFVPKVLISTTLSNGKIHLSIEDNGTGIPDKIKDQIFEPFFTTKPAGKGTGLGLSISNEIILAHHGELKVETKQNEFTRFMISLPAA
ncbi:MAG: GHKL domain-containing protein [Bacteroidetes bacterium]|nr:GHKL domain-containing protein [Bacteroidota bacterium]